MNPMKSLKTQIIFDQLFLVLFACLVPSYVIAENIHKGMGYWVHPVGFTGIMLLWTIYLIISILLEKKGLFVPMKEYANMKKRLLFVVFVFIPYTLFLAYVGNNLFFASSMLVVTIVASVVWTFYLIKKNI